MWDYTSGIDDVVDSIEELIGEGYASEAIELVEHALAAVEGAIELVDDSDGGMGGILYRLQEIHLRACRKAKPDPEELANKLFYWELNSDWEVFRGAAETYGRVFGKKGLVVYRELAEAEWNKLPRLTPKTGERGSWSTRHRITTIMESLARQSGDVEELVRVKSRDLSSPYYFLQIAEIYKEDGQHDKALEWAEQGVKEFPDRPDDRLLVFLADQYLRKRRHDEAMELIWAVFSKSPWLEQYKLLKVHADKTGQWPTWREKALALIRERTSGKNNNLPSWRRQDHSLLVEVFLWEKDINAAWDEAIQGGCSDALWFQLAKKKEKSHPEDAVQAYKRLIEPTIDQKNKPAYREAVDLLKKINTLMIRLRQEEEFVKYLEAIKTAHKRKRNLMKLLDRAKFS